MKFLGNVLATVVGLFTFLLLLLFGIAGIGMIFNNESTDMTVKSNSVLELQLSQVTEDYGGTIMYKDFNQTETSHSGVFDIIAAIEKAKTDESIKGISIINDVSNLGMAQRKAIRDALQDFKKTGKFVLAYANSYTQKEYYVCSVATTVFINPVGDFDFKGLSAELMFFKDLQENTGVKMEVIRHGKYKSAVEPFLENKMSDANKEQTTSLLLSLWETVINDISKSRQISVSQLNSIANDLLARTPQMAKKQKLIDVIAYEDEYHDAIKKLLNTDKNEEYNKIGIIEYATNSDNTTSNPETNNRIAVVYAQGEIQSGEGDITTIGEGSMKRSLIEIRNNKDIKAVVIRINSPGGNALTSELIWREIELTKKIKPVVVSMGNYAASGGYYIACNAHKIFAENNTITGSIGVFGILPNFAPLATRMGIHTEQVKTNPNAAEYSPFLPMDENIKAVTTESVEQVYNTFLKRVAKGRKMTLAQVDTIAQGRVWSGSQALKIGLIDKIGGMKEALQCAASMAKIKEYETVNFPEYEKSFSEILQNLGIPFTKTKESFIQEELGSETFYWYDKIKKMQKRSGIQALLPYELTIR